MTIQDQVRYIYATFGVDVEGMNSEQLNRLIDALEALVIDVESEECE